VPVTFTVAVSAVPAATYQWKKDGVAIAGATAASYAIASPGVADAGTYTVVATNSAGFATSAGAALTLSGPPTITLDPVSQTVTAGANVTFTAAAAGPAPITYQWKKNSVDLGGATDASLTLMNVLVSDTGSYTVVATNTLGSTPSAAALLTVNPAAPAAPVSAAATGVTAAGFTANWNAAAGATGYRLDVSTDVAFGSFVTGYQDLDVGAGLTRSVSGLSASTTYYYRVRAFNGLASASSATIAVTTSAAPAADLVNDTFSDTDRIGGADGSNTSGTAPLVSTPHGDEHPVGGKPGQATRGIRHRHAVDLRHDLQRAGPGLFPILHRRFHPGRPSPSASPPGLPAAPRTISASHWWTTRPTDAAPRTASVRPTPPRWATSATRF